MADSLGPRLVRRETRVKIMRKRTERAIAIAIKTGVVAVGAVRRSGAFVGRADKSYVGDTVDGVHVTGPLLFGREHDPRRPKNTVGPSISLDDEGSDSCNDGETTRRATRL